MKPFWETTDAEEFREEVRKFGESVVRKRLPPDCRFVLLVMPEGTDEAVWVCDLPGEAELVKELELVLAKLKGKENK